MEKCSLSIECRFLSSHTPVFNGELICRATESEPVVGQTFYLLNRSAEEILEENRNTIWVFPPEPNFRRPNADLILGKYINEILSSAIADSGKHLIALLHIAALTSETTPLIHTSHLIATELLSTQAIRILWTDWQGSARTADLKAGTYYVCGVFTMDSRARVWNARIDLTPGENSLLLDNYNSL